MAIQAQSVANWPQWNIENPAGAQNQGTVLQFVTEQQ
jgi:hypothetical protein